MNAVMSPDWREAEKRRKTKGVYRIAGKIDGKLNLAVKVETTKLKSANIIALMLCDRWLVF